MSKSQIHKSQNLKISKMPPKRKKTSSRTAGTKRQRFFRAARRFPRGAITPQKIHTFRQVVQLAPLISPATAGVWEVNKAFILNDLDQVTTFTALFDAYRIDRVTVTYWPKGTQNPMGAALTAQNTKMYTAIDLDDVANLGTVAALRQYETCVITTANRKIVREIVPRVASSLYNGITAAYSESKAGLWVDCAYPAVEHYGIRAMLEATLAAGDATYDVTAEYIVSFKNVR